MTEKELEKLFKSKLDTREFEFNPANWEAMEAMLASEPAPAGTFYWRSVAAILLFAVGVWSMINFMPQSGDTKVVNEEIATPVEQFESQMKGEERQESNVPQVETKNIAEQSDEIVNAAKENVVSNSVAENTTARHAEKEVVVASDETSAEEQVVGENPTKEELEESGSLDPVPLVPYDHKSVGYEYQLVSNQNVLFPLNEDEEESFTPDALNKFRSKKSFYLEVAPVFTGSHNANNVGFGWEAGIGYQQEFDNNLVFNVGVNYLVQNGVDISSTSDSVFYNFGKEVVQTEEISKRLDYVEVPLSVGYKLNEKHRLQIGGYAGYLVNVSQEVNREISGFKTETKYEQLTKSGYQDDFNRWDFGLNFGYRYTLTPAVSVGLHYSMGLKDITRNTGGDYELRHTNQSTRVIFRYSFL